MENVLLKILGSQHQIKVTEKVYVWVRVREGQCCQVERRASVPSLAHRSRISVSSRNSEPEIPTSPSQIIDSDILTLVRL